MASNNFRGSTKAQRYAALMGVGVVAAACNSSRVAQVVPEISASQGPLGALIPVAAALAFVATSGIVTAALSYGDTRDVKFAAVTGAGGVATNTATFVALTSLFDGFSNLPLVIHHLGLSPDISCNCSQIPALTAVGGVVTVVRDRLSGAGRPAFSAKGPDVRRLDYSA